MAADVVPGLVSVITACRNAESFVSATIESIAAQTYPRIEHIVVDDGSTDGSREVIESYGGAVKLIRRSWNGGASSARNAGVEIARGAYLLFLDADDLVSPDAIATMVAKSSANPGAIVHCSWGRLRWIEGGWKPAPADVPPPDPSVDGLRSWLSGRWVPPCAILWPRAVYDRTGGWDEEIGFNDDADLMLRAFVEGTRLVASSGGRAWYRAPSPGAESLSHAPFSEARCRSNLRVHRKLAERLEETGALDAYAATLGFIFRDQGSRAFLEGDSELGRECVALAERYGTADRLARTRPGHVLTRLLGVRGKERVARTLASVGIMTADRRRVMTARSATAGETGRGGDGPP
jgi:GT2 family glycosyltransferase